MTDITEYLETHHKFGLGTDFYTVCDEPFYLQLCYGSLGTAIHCVLLLKEQNRVVTIK